MYHGKLLERKTSSSFVKQQRQERGSSKQQVRYMIMSLREAWNKFKEEHSTPKMCLLKFCELRPPNVKLFDQLPHQVCLCSYHENVRLLLAGLGEHTSLSAELLSKLPVISKKCMTREYSTCDDMIDWFSPQAHSESLRYYQWKSTDNRIEKIVAIDTVDMIFNKLKKQLNTFLLHTFVKRERESCYI